jgi:hypothetical protein
MSEKVSRRSVIKAFGVAGVALAAAPYLAKASAIQQLSGPQKSAPTIVGSQASRRNYSTEPLVLVVRGDQILGYRGLEELPLQDASLAGLLDGIFSSKGAMA